MEQIFSQNDNTSVQKEKYFALNLQTITCLVNELISARTIRNASLPVPPILLHTHCV